MIEDDLRVLDVDFFSLLLVDYNLNNVYIKIFNSIIEIFFSIEF